MGGVAGRRSGAMVSRRRRSIGEPTLVGWRQAALTDAAALSDVAAKLFDVTGFEIKVRNPFLFSRHTL